jgi:hypothetical protein
MADLTDPAEPALVDFSVVPRRLQTVGMVLAALALLGCVVDGVVNGLTFALMGRWVGLFAVVMLVATAVTTALHALGGADRAGKRGVRLASPDVGIGPRRFAPAEPQEPDPTPAGEDG